jgi:integrase
MATVRQYRGRYVADFRDQNGRRRIEVPEGPFETKAEQKRAAKELLDRRLLEVRQHTFTPDRQRLGFAGLCELFLASKVKARKTTLDGYRELINCYLAPYFGVRRIETLTRFEVERFRNDMAKGAPPAVAKAREERIVALKAAGAPTRLRALEPGPRTTNKCLTLLVGILGYAVEHGFASRNAAASMDKLPKAEGEGAVIESNVLAPYELRKLIDASADPWGMPIMFAAFTGCRQAEGAGLQWGDIDWNRRTAEIRRQWRRGAFYEPKTKSSRRTVELPDELVAALKRWKLRCPLSEHDLVFPDAKGRPMRSSDLLRTGLHAALRRAKLRQVRFHDLRHSFASNLLGAGTDIVTVSKALGHANVHITLTTYAHAIPRERQGAGDALARLMGQSGNKMETLTPKTGFEAGQNIRQVVDLNDIGEVAERLNAPVLKTGAPSRGSRVRISPSPPIEAREFDNPALRRVGRRSEAVAVRSEAEDERRPPRAISPSPPKYKRDLT